MRKLKWLKKRWGHRRATPVKGRHPVTKVIWDKQYRCATCRLPAVRVWDHEEVS